MWEEEHKKVAKLKVWYRMYLLILHHYIIFVPSVEVVEYADWTTAIVLEHPIKCPG